MCHDSIQQKASQLKQRLEYRLGSTSFRKTPSEIPDKVKLAHCHELIAAAFGFNSKKAMIDQRDGIQDWDDREFYLSEWQYSIHNRHIDDQLIRTRIRYFKDSPLQHIASSFVIGAILWVLAPCCKDCGEKDPDGKFVYDDAGNETIDYVCQHCAQDERHYDTCQFCGVGRIYPESLINSAGECPVHDGESRMSPERREDWISYVDYLNKHSY